MQLEVGKYYKTRDGLKVGPMYLNGHNNGWPFSARNSSFTYSLEGSFPFDKRPSEYDLVAEWVEEETKAVPIISAESIDSITKDSLRHHFKEGKDMEPLQREAFRIVMRHYGVNDV
jgi:hypothetical protein